MPKIKEESWSLTSADTLAIPAANRADGVASVWSDIWKYQVPTGQAHVLKPSHRFSFYGASAGPVECTAVTKVRILVRDQSEQDEVTIYGPSLYVASKEFQDVRKMAYLMLPAERTVEEMFFIVVQVNYALVLDESISYFRLETTRIRNTI